MDATAIEHFQVKWTRFTVENAPETKARAVPCEWKQLLSRSGTEPPRTEILEKTKDIPIRIEGDELQVADLLRIPPIPALLDRQQDRASGLNDRPVQSGDVAHLD